MRHAPVVPDLTLTSRQRRDRLTNAETVRLGRVLAGNSARSHVSFPAGTETAVIVVHDCVAALRPGTVARVAAVIGEFDQERA